jgi:hypothetical protein
MQRAGEEPDQCSERGAVGQSKRGAVGPVQVRLRVCRSRMALSWRRTRVSTSLAALRRAGRGQPPGSAAEREIEHAERHEKRWCRTGGRDRRACLIRGDHSLAPTRSSFRRRRHVAGAAGWWWMPWHLEVVHHTCRSGPPYVEWMSSAELAGRRNQVVIAGVRVLLRFVNVFRLRGCCHRRAGS